MAWFDDTSRDSRGRLPIGGEKLPERSAAGMDEAQRREFDQLMGPLGPPGIAADFGPSEAGLQQVHVRVGFKESRPRFVGVKCPIGGAELPLDRAAQFEGTALEFAARIERDGRGGLAQQDEGLVVEHGPIVEGRSIDAGQGPKQAIGPIQLTPMRRACMLLLRGYLVVAVCMVIARVLQTAAS